jgi:hypothetical protein
MTLECGYHAKLRDCGQTTGCGECLHCLNDLLARTDGERDDALAQVAYEQERNRNNVLALTAERDEALAAMSSDGADAVGENQILRSDRDSWRKLAEGLAESLRRVMPMLHSKGLALDAVAALAAYDAKVKESAE